MSFLINSDQPVLHPSANIALSPFKGVAPSHGAKESDMLWTIFVILLVLWLLGFSLHIAGGLIHLLLVLALIMLIYNLIVGRRTVL
jgi:hypothetical protein